MFVILSWLLLTLRIPQALILILTITNKCLTLTVTWHKLKLNSNLDVKIKFKQHLRKWGPAKSGSCSMNKNRQMTHITAITCISTNAHSQLCIFMHRLQSLWKACPGFCSTWHICIFLFWLCCCSCGYTWFRIELWDRQAATAPSVVAHVLAVGERGNRTSVRFTQKNTVEFW